MTQGKSPAKSLRLTGLALNVITIAIYLIAATQALRGILPDMPAKAFAQSVSLALR